MSDPVAEARALLANATPGPWRARGADIEGPEWSVASAVDDGHRPCDMDFAEKPWPPFPADDAALIAAAPDLLARLCDEVERLRAEVARLTTPPPDSAWRQIDEWRRTDGA